MYTYIARTTPPLVPERLLGLAALGAIMAWTPSADAAERSRYSSASLIQRRGGQAEGMLGISACLPGKASCESSSLERTGPLVGGSVNLGFRPIPYLFLGAGYSLGFFDPSTQGQAAMLARYRSAHQHTVVAVIRGIWPVGRFDFGVELSPGWSRQKFVAEESLTPAPDEYSQGFALKPGLSINVWLTRSVFLGVEANTIVNLHDETCRSGGGQTICQDKEKPDHAAVHQLLAGLVVGGTF